LLLPPTGTDQLAFNSAPASSDVSSGESTSAADDATAADRTVNFGEPGSKVRVVNGGVSLPDYWTGEDE
jgi:hypothetical protein